MDRFLDNSQAKHFYDQFGSKQDHQGWYEDKPLATLTREAKFSEAHKVFELGCGTGKYAKSLFEEVFPDDCVYTAVELSTTMSKLAQENLSNWSERADVYNTSGDLDLSAYGTGHDRFVSTYVLDLMSPKHIEEAIAAAHQLLQTGGLLCTAGLTKGNGVVTHVTSSIWSTLHKIRPALVGGCRPIKLGDFLPQNKWQILYNETIVSSGLASEVLIAEAL